METLVYKYYLAHHGIKGQKWGVRNGPPYPLGESNRSESEVSSSFIDRYKNRTVSSLGTSGPLGEFAVATLASVAVPVLTARLGSKLIENRWRKRMMKELEDNYKTRDIRTLSDAPRLAHKMSAKDSLKVINPSYPSIGATMNCTLCTTAMAMREKGYDVRAKTSTDGFDTDDLFGKLFNSKDIKMPRKTNPESALNLLASCGDNAYGNLTVTWKLGGGHSVFWKNENGRTHIYDGQSGEEITKSASSTKQFFSSVNCHQMRYNRFDNHEPTEYVLGAVERTAGNNEEGHQ